MNSKKTIQNSKEMSILSQLLCWLKERGETGRAEKVELLLKENSPYQLVREVIQWLGFSNPWARAAAAECLGAIGRTEAVTPLCHALTDHFSEVRGAAAESLGILLTEKKDCPGALARKISDPDTLVRLQVAEALGLIGDKRTLPRLWKSLRDRSPLVRRYVCSAIGQLGDQADLRRLKRELKSERNDMTKLGYFDAIYSLGDRGIFPALLALLESKDYRVRCAVANTLSGEFVNSSNSKTVLAILRKALKDESTVAARSTLEASIRTIRKRFKQKK